MRSHVAADDDLMTVTRRVDMYDPDYELVGTVTIPANDGLRLWRETEKITWSCRASACDEVGIGSSEDDALALLRAHLVAIHGLVLPESAG
jgi:hypothetical protein